MRDFKAEYYMKPFNICATIVIKTGQHCPGNAIHKIGESNDYLCDECYKIYNLINH